MGREAGKKCVIVEIIDKSFVLITGPKALTGVKRRRANVQHLKPTRSIIKIERGAGDEEIIEVLKADGKIEEMKAEVKLEV